LLGGITFYRNSRWLWCVHQLFLQRLCEFVAAKPVLHLRPCV
jgi:hypothetical protein